ncbi:MAG: AAA family ATPase [Microbispora sp.]|nr:AAA family ATPase [Microbispora sp.]
MIVLTGMPGCGKTTVGRALGRLADLPVFDTDEILLREYGDLLGPCPSDREWRRFRALESRLVIALADTHRDGVLALGGGAWMDREVRDRISGRHISVYLRCSLDRLVERNKGRNRVMFGSGDLRSELDDLLRRRKKEYELADLVVPVDDESADGAAARIAHRTSVFGSADAI